MRATPGGWPAGRSHGLKLTPMAPAPIAAILSITRIPLIPVIACYNLGANGAIGWSGMLALAIDIAYIIGLSLLAAYWMAKRDLILH